MKTMESLKEIPYPTSTPLFPQKKCNEVASLAKSQKTRRGVWRRDAAGEAGGFQFRDFGGWDFSGGKFLIIW